MQVMVDGLLATYERQGSGRIILLLHGWGDRAQGLHTLRVALGKHFDVIALDLPGFGGTQSPKDAWNLSDYAQFVADFLNKLGIDKAYAIVGHSNGGAIAIRGVASGRLKADRLILLASAGIRGESSGRNQLLRPIVKGGKMIAALLPRRLRAVARKKVYQMAGSDMLVAEHLQETFKRIVADDVRSDAKNLHLPTLLLYGDQDNATPVRYGHILNELIEGSKLMVITGAGHFVYLDSPHETLDAITEFLA